jgi:DNA-binding MarR family transcriptional regulator
VTHTRSPISIVARPSAVPEQLVESILALASRLSRTVNADVRHQKLTVPLTMGQFRTLNHMAKGYNTPAELAEHLIVTRSTVTRLIDGMERRGLVTRAVDSNDRRQVRLELTDSGKAILREVRRKAYRRIQERLDQLSEPQQEQVRRAVKIIDQVLLS